jgi:hypothetical protein
MVLTIFIGKLKNIYIKHSLIVVPIPRLTSVLFRGDDNHKLMFFFLAFFSGNKILKGLFSVANKKSKQLS